MVVAGVLALAGAFFVWQAALLDLGNVALPGPGFFPLLLGAVLVMLATADRRRPLAVIRRRGGRARAS